MNDINHEIDDMFEEMTSEVRRISGCDAFEYPKKYIDFYKQAMMNGKGSRKTGEWCLFGGKLYVQTEMQLLKQAYGITNVVPIASERDSCSVVCMSVNRKSADSSELLGVHNSSVPLTMEGDIPVLEVYTWDEFFDLF